MRELIALDLHTLVTSFSSELETGGKVSYENVFIRLKQSLSVLWTFAGSGEILAIAVIALVLSKLVSCRFLPL